MSFVSRNHPQQVAVRGALDEVDDRGTDQAFFDSLSERFGGFTLDVAAAPHNAKCREFYTRGDDGLSQPWEGSVWCNPPYSNLNPWLFKAWQEWENRSRSDLRLIVMLLPANRVEQGWWQDYVEPYRDKAGSLLRVEFLRGRMRFDRPNAVIGPKGDRPPFGCCLLIWGGVVRPRYFVDIDGYGDTTLWRTNPGDPTPHPIVRLIDLPETARFLWPHIVEAVSG